MNNLALLLQDGTEGVEQNGRDADELHHEAFAGGNVDAMNNVALLLQDGAEGVQWKGGER